MKRNQSGMTLISFVVVLVVVGFALYVGMKLFPMYQEYYAVTTSMKGLSSEMGVADMEPEKLQKMFFKRLDINASESVKPENVKFERVDGGWRMHVSYEVRRELIGNLDVVGKFDRSQDLTSRGVK